MKLLVCGGAGFIGSNFIRYFLEARPDCRLVNYDKLTYAGNLDNLAEAADDPRYKFVPGDIGDLEKVSQVIEENQLDHLINFAAETHVDRSIHGGAKEFVLTNTLGVQMLLDAARRHGLKKMINVSTDEVYGALGLDEPREFTEGTPIAPNMPYAAAKAGGDLMCHAYFVTHGTPVIVTHCSNNYGPYQFPEKLIPFFIFKALAGESLPVYGDGLNVRDWIQVQDHCRALSLLLDKGAPGEVYNIGADNERNNLEITKLILKHIFGGSTSEYSEAQPPNINGYHFVADRPGHDRRYAIDASKIRALGWQPLYPRAKFEQGLMETIQWYLNNKEWVAKLMKRRAELNPHI